MMWSWASEKLINIEALYEVSSPESLLLSRAPRANEDTILGAPSTPPSLASESFSRARMAFSLHVPHCKYLLVYC